jgi:hypothetical protein
MAAVTEAPARTPLAGTDEAQVANRAATESLFNAFQPFNRCAPFKTFQGKAPFKVKQTLGEPAAPLPRGGGDRLAHAPPRDPDA